MTDEAPPLTRYDLEAKIVKRCWQDEAFRREFTADPVGTAVKYLEVPAANLPHIVVHEEPAGAWHIVLPARPAEAGELSEADLERVAAGFGGAIGAIVVTVGVLLGSTALSGVGASAVVTVNRGW
jgi:hypothetical protein